MEPISQANYGISPELSHSQVQNRGDASNNEAISLANEVPALPNPSIIDQCLEQIKKIDWKVACSKALSLFASVALGVLTVAAITGLLTTPAGWGIACGLLLIGLIGSAKYGGPKAFLEAIKLSVVGFSAGFGFKLAGFLGAIGFLALGLIASASLGRIRP